MDRKTRMTIVALTSLLVLTTTVVAEDLDQWKRGRPQTKTPVLHRGGLPAPGTPDGDRQRERSVLLGERNHAVHELLGPRHISRRAQDLLAARGLGAARDPWDDTKATPHPDTLRVLIVRIDFETDRSGDLTSVTTDGGFTLEPDPTISFDPPPHDRDFYMAHLFGLSEYYRIQSGGRLHIQGRVLPEDPTGAYTLSDIADYGPGENGSWDIPGLERLVRDMIIAADEGTQDDGAAILADYDDDDPLTYVIFVHAGGDWQSDVNQDSPNDIPTFFVTLGEPQALTSTDSDGGGFGALSECSVIPETTSQDGWPGSIAGALYHEFGHALGLPDVYSTRTGLPMVGIWDLMDSGPNVTVAVGFDDDEDDVVDRVEYVSGLMPPSLGAWCRWYLGWLRTDVLTGDERNVHLPAVQVPLEDYFTWYGGGGYDFSPMYPQAVIAGASAREFFLLENRWVPAKDDELPDDDDPEFPIGFVADVSGVILYMGGDEDEFGNYRNTAMYDYFLPGGGLLVWHVNQDRIDEGLADNTVNWYGDGLRILEADGIQDVGVYDGYTIGFWGTELDPFHAGKDTIPATADHLDLDGRPCTRAHDRSWTGAYLSGISGPHATMTFDGGVRPFHDGSPWELPAFTDLPDSVGPRRLDPATVTPFALDGEPVLVAASSPADAGEGVEAAAWLFAWRPGGGAAAGTLYGGPTASVWNAGDGLAGPPVVIDTADGAAEQLVVATPAGVVTAFPASRTGAAWIPSWTVDLNAPSTYAPVPVSGAGDAALLVQHGDNGYSLLDADGGLVDVIVFLDPPGAVPDGAPAPSATVLSPTSTAAFLAVHGAWYLRDADVLLASGDLPDDVHDARAAVLRDGARTRFVLTGPETFTIVDWDGSEAATTSVTSPLRGSLRGEPAVADLNGDGRDDLIIVSDTHLHAYDADLQPLTGWPVQLLGRFPLAADVACDGGLAVFDGDGDGLDEIWATTDAGHLVVFDSRATLLERTPFLWGAGDVDGMGAALAVGPAGEAGRVLWLAEPGGRPAWGLGVNGVRGRLAAYLPPTETRAGGTSEWLGVAGGPRRTGRVGDPAVVVGNPADDDRGTFVIYPNPWRDGEVTFRYWAEGDGAARVTIFNLEGEIVATVDGEAQADRINEIPWSPDVLASGVYLCRFTIPGAAGTVTRLERLAVER